MGELEALERAGWEALCGPDGGAFYSEHMLDAGLMVFPGSVMEKAVAVEGIRAAEPWATFELANVREAIDGDVGLIAYSATAQRGDSPPYRAEMSSVYVRTDGRWLLLLHQQSLG